MRIPNFGFLRETGVSGNKTKAILGDLTKSLRGEVTQAVYTDSVKKVRFFGGCDDGFITAICLEMDTALFSSNETVIQKGEKAESMYFIQKGLVVGPGGRRAGGASLTTRGA